MLRNVNFCVCVCVQRVCPAFINVINDLCCRTRFSLFSAILKRIYLIQCSYEPAWNLLCSSPTIMVLVLTCMLVTDSFVGFL